MPDLKVNQKLSGKLKKEQSKHYQIKLEKDQFVAGFVDQLSVDVVVHVYDPDGYKIKKRDRSPRGAEHFNFQTKKAGIHKIEVAPFKAKTGEYSIEITNSEAIATDPEKRMDQLFASYDNDYTPGAVYAVYKDGKIHSSKSYGMANLSHNIPFEKMTISNIGSVSKQFTAMAILLLEKEGKINLEDAVRKHLPEFPEFNHTITIRNLLNHTNGLREIFNIMSMRGWDMGDVLIKEEALNIVQRQKNLQGKPGESFNYNNTAFILLTEIIERIGDKPFPDWMKANVFEPLGMKNTLVRKDPYFIIPNSAQGYSPGEKGYQEQGDLHTSSGAGGIYTTAEDMTKWMGNFHSKKLGGKAVIEKLTTPNITANGDTIPYSLGLFVDDYKGLMAYHHGGADIAHRAMLKFFPEINAGVFCMSNNGAFPSNVMNDKIADVFFKEHFTEKEETKKEAVSIITLTPETLKKYEGEFKATIGPVIKYYLEDDKLMAQPDGQDARAMLATSDTTFNYSGVDASITFHKNKSGEFASATHFQSGMELLMNKVEDIKLSQEEMEFYAGSYYSEELQMVYNIQIENDHLIIRVPNLKDITMTPSGRNTFDCDVFFISNLRFKKDAMGKKVKGFEISDPRTGDVFFKKIYLD